MQQINYYKEIEINVTSSKIGTFIVTDVQKHEKEFGKIAKVIKVNDEIFVS